MEDDLRARRADFVSSFLRQRVGRTSLVVAALLGYRRKLRAPSLPGFIRRRGQQRYRSQLLCLPLFTWPGAPRRAARTSPSPSKPLRPLVIEPGRGPRRDTIGAEAVRVKAASHPRMDDRTDTTEGFRVLDTWTLPVTLGAHGGFDDLVDLFVANGFATDGRVANALFRIRFALGRLLRWDDPASGPRPVYRRADDAMFAIRNKTVDARIRLRAEGGDGVRMDILVKDVSRWTGAYLALIRPFRHRVVYPALLARIERRWNQRPPAST